MRMCVCVFVSACMYLCVFVSACVCVCLFICVSLCQCVCAVVYVGNWSDASPAVNQIISQLVSPSVASLSD